MYSLQQILQRYGHRRLLPDVDPAPPYKLPSEEDVRRGLALGEFKAWFQPKFEMNGTVLAGAEALARWEHPVRGLLLPKDFLAAVLAYDLIDEMLMQMLEQGMSLLHALRQSGLGVELAFNLHASQLARDDLTDHIHQVLKSNDFPGSTLLFEVAENGLLDIPRATRENLLRPVISSTLALGEALGMSVVIEGIETEEQRQELLALGCTQGQGYLCARPMGREDLLSWLDARRIAR